MAYINGKQVLFSPKIITYNGYKEGQLSVLKDSKYMNANESGSIISVNDVSPVEHNLEVKVGSKNIFDAETVLPTFINQNYPTFYWKKQADGSWYLGNVAVLAGNIWYENTEGYTGQIAISITAKAPEGTDGSISLRLHLNYTDGTTEFINCYHSDDFVTYTLLSNANKTVHTITQGASIGYNTYLKDVMIAYGTDTTYTPYMTDFEGIEVTRCGKNLFDGSIKKEGLTLSGTGNNRTVVYNNGADGHKIIKVKPNTTYYFSGDFSAAKDNNIRFASFTEYPTENSVSNKFGYTSMSRVFTTTANDNYLFVWATVAQKTTDIAMQIEEGTTETEYEAYNGQTATANADGTVEGLTSLSPNMTLYTDNDGAIVNCQYYRDIDTYIDNLLINLAMTGGV